MGRPADQCKWFREVNNAVILPSLDVEEYFDSWNEIALSVRTTLFNAVFVAPSMVREALGHLNRHLAYESPTANLGTWTLARSMPENPDHSDVGQGLLKYFNLKYRVRTGPVNPDYWRCVRGILAVFSKIQTGLSSPYKLELGFFVGRGRVKMKKGGQADVSPIRATFGFPDEWGHVPYFGPQSIGRIQIAYDYIEESYANPDFVARTIVHESSHKWGFTKDVLYKHGSFAKSARLDDQQQERLTILGRKDLLPMTGYEAGTQFLISPERWLENADSYAWFARRMWKRSGRARG